MGNLKLIDKEKYWDIKERLKYLEEMKEDCMMHSDEETLTFFIKSKGVVITEHQHYITGLSCDLETWDEYINKLKSDIKLEEDDNNEETNK